MKSCGHLLIFAILFLMPVLNYSQGIRIFFYDTGLSIKSELSRDQKIDTLFVNRILHEQLIKLYNKGYLAASIDSVSFDSANLRAFGLQGKPYRWAKILPDSITQISLNDLGLRIPEGGGKIVTPQQLSRLTKTIISSFEDSGYPFISVKFDDVNINGNRIDATLHINKGTKISIDTIYIKGVAKVKSKIVIALLDLKKGDAYSESKINAIDRKITKQPYLSIIKPSEIEFLNHTARVYCYLNCKSASRFSGLAGFYNDENDGSIKLNGDINLSLVNTMRNGEKLNFAWNAPGRGTQNLNIETEWPYIFDLQIGVLGNFSLYKHDSTYITINPKMSLQLFTSTIGKFLLNLDFKKTSISSTNQASSLQYMNTASLLYGVGYEYNSLNGVILPSKGWYIKSSINTGSRSVSQSSINSSLIEGDVNVKAFMPLYEERIILALVSNSKIKDVYSSKSSTKLYENEMYRVGGMGSIRGFNQESVLSRAYSVATAELHLRVSEGSGFYFFIDKAFVKSYELGLSRDSWPMGLGIGLNLVTKAGLFNLSYAVGDGFGQSISFRDAKVHFGIATLF